MRMFSGLLLLSSLVLSFDTAAAAAAGTDLDHADCVPSPGPSHSPTNSSSVEERTTTEVPTQTPSWSPSQGGSNTPIPTPSSSESSPETPSPSESYPETSSPSEASPETPSPSEASPESREPTWGPTVEDTEEPPSTVRTVTLGPEPTSEPVLPPPSGTPKSGPSEPEFTPTHVPLEPTSQPTSEVASEPTSEPASDTSEPTSEIASEPTSGPTSILTEQDTEDPPSTVRTVTAEPQTPSPSVSTLSPSQAETLEPSPFPTVLQPSQRQTTVAPVPDDDDLLFITPNPTESPVRSPTEFPSPRPIIITPRPTLRRTNSPTESPTESPTKSPTESPTESPTSEPTARPTRRATPEPTRTTDGPTFFPTSSPTAQPTTGSPTGAPTIFRTEEPSRMPSVRPTPTGSFWPTDSLTLSPSQYPTFTPPSPFPTNRVTGVPTLSPTSFPSALPSSAPSFPLQSELVEAVMFLSPYNSSNVLAGQAIIAWESATASHIREYILSADVQPSIDDLQVGTNIVGQTIFFPDANTEGGSTRKRALQQRAASEPTLIITFDVAISFRSESTEHNLARLVFSAWDGVEDGAEYITNLKSEASTKIKFGRIETVEVQVKGLDPPDGPRDKFLDLLILIGSSVGAAALIFLVVCLYLRRRNAKDMDDVQDSRATPDTAPKIAVSTEILVEPQDDISTLGDPMFAPGGMLIGSLEKDEVTASVGEDYDYAIQYRRALTAATGADSSSRDRMSSEDLTKSSSANSTNLSKSHVGGSLFADDASFEQQFADPEERFEVVAPAGKLGMVIDTPNGGPPVVHAIKETSVLADRVRVGDRLLSVDDEDCTPMTAMQVSKLISLKSEKPARILVFLRSRTPAPGRP